LRGVANLSGFVVVANDLHRCSHSSKKIAVMQNSTALRKQPVVVGATLRGKDTRYRPARETHMAPPVWLAEFMASQG
jgi:hypothetical protein